METNLINIIIIENILFSGYVTSMSTTGSMGTKFD
jgi:hypothetical protein